jgi:hypothetical protein
MCFCGDSNNKVDVNGKSVWFYNGYTNQCCLQKLPWGKQKSQDGELTDSVGLIWTDGYAIQPGNIAKFGDMRPCAAGENEPLGCPKTCSAGKSCIKYMRTPISLKEGKKSEPWRLFDQETWDKRGCCPNGLNEHECKTACFCVNLEALNSELPSTTPVACDINDFK